MVSTFFMRSIVVVLHGISLSALLRVELQQAEMKKIKEFFASYKLLS